MLRCQSQRRIEILRYMLYYIKYLILYAQKNLRVCQACTNAKNYNKSSPTKVINIMHHITHLPTIYASKVNIQQLTNALIILLLFQL